MTRDVTPLKRVARVRVSNVDKKSAEGEVPVRLCNYTDVYYQDVIHPDLEFMVATASPEQIALFRLRAGDVIVTKDSETAEDIGVPAYVAATSDDLVCGYHLAVIRPQGNLIDGRYLYWAMSSDSVRNQLTVAATGVTRFGLRTDALAGTVIPTPPVEVQRAIADYLDVETARIDALIEKKRRMVELLEDELTSTVEDIIWSRAISTMPLKYRTDQNRPIMYGIVLPGPNVSDGVPIVKGGDVAARRLSPGLVNRTTREIEAPYARARLAEDDLVFAIRGSVGEVEIVPKELAGANITQDVARVSTARDVLPEWLYYVLRSMPVQRQASERTTGATIRGLNIWELKRIRVPTSDLVRQKSDLDALQPVWRRIEQMRATLDRQVSLLIEHRQALITAAVTGDLPIPGVAA